MGQSRSKAEHEYDDGETECKTHVLQHHDTSEDITKQHVVGAEPWCDVAPRAPCLCYF